MICIRKMKTEDVDQVCAMEQLYFSMPWSRQALLEAAVNDKALYLVAEDMASGEVVGYCGMYCILGEGDINQVAVKADWRRQGLGRRLLQDFLQEGSKQGITAFTLEVRAGNEAAIHLYESCGFRAEGVRKNYYEKPTEDALIMWKR